MSFTEHQKRLAVMDPDTGCGFNDLMKEDPNNEMSISQRIEQFNNKEFHVRHDDFSGLPTSFLLKDI